MMSDKIKVMKMIGTEDVHNAMVHILAGERRVLTQIGRDDNSFLLILSRNRFACIGRIKIVEIT